VVNDSLEFVHALVFRNVSLSSKASSNDKEAGLGRASISCLDCPLSSLLVEFCRGHNGLESGVFAQVADFIHIVKVGLKLLPTWVIGCKGPSIVDFRDG
jgi:hypothetical protein